MSWVTIIWAMMAGVSTTLAGIYLVAWFLGRKDASYVAFVVVAASVAAMAGVELWMMKAQSAAELGEALRWYQVPVFTGFCSMVALVYLRLRPRHAWVGWLAVALRTASLVVNFAAPTNLNYTEITGIRHIRVFGESVTVAIAEPNPWMLFGQASLLLALLFVIDGGVSAWRRGGRERALRLVISLSALLALGTLQAVLVFWAGVDVPMTVTPLFLLTALAMAHEVSDDLLRAERAQASSDAKSRFLSSASHELRAPLHDLLGYAQLLARQIPPEAQAHLAVIRKSGQQLLRLIDDILEFSRGDAKPIVLDPAPMSLPALAAHLRATCTPAAARGGNRLEMRVRLTSVQWVIADERRLTQVLRNLIDNACKYTRDGLIELGIETIDAQTGKTGAAEGSHELWVRFSVRDTGVGIPADQQEAVFDPFKRLNRYDHAPGLGLGLAICQQIVAAQGGRIRVQSRQGQDSGSCFSFDLRLPMAEAESDAAGVESPGAILGYGGRPRTVLVVDDRASSRRLLAEQCELLGLEVLEAATGRDALELLRTVARTPDLALVDQFMPELDGWGFLRCVRADEAHRSLPVVLVSAASLQPPEGFPGGVEFDEVALKPLSAAALTEILQRHLDLVWEYAETDLPSDDDGSACEAEPTELSLPPGCCDLKLTQLKEMLALGAVVAIDQWADEMATTYPEHGELWDAIRHRANRVDLVGLRDLVARLRPATAGAEQADEAC